MVTTPVSRSRRVAPWLGGIEIILGVSLLYFGCRYGWLADDTAANIGGTYAVLFAACGLVLPGALLCSKSPARWAGQLVPIACLGSYLLALLLAPRPH